MNKSLFGQGSEASEAEHTIERVDEADKCKCGAYLLPEDEGGICVNCRLDEKMRREEEKKMKEKALVPKVEMTSTLMPVAVDKVIEKATEVSKKLKNIVDQAKLSIKIGGNEYLEFEAWQTLGAFYGVTAKVEWTKPTSTGFEARAVALRNGNEISGAEAECNTDEPNWENKPQFQLRSMAQTRASAKCLRNCLAWVVVLAGFKATPAEEMIDITPQKPASPTPPPAERKEGDKIISRGGIYASQPQIDKFILPAIKEKGLNNKKVKEILGQFGCSYIDELRKSDVNNFVTKIRAVEI